MSPGNTRKRVRQFGELLEAPFRPKRPKSTRPGLTSALSNNTSGTTTLSNPISRSVTQATGSTYNRIATSSTLAGPAHAIGNQSPNPQSPTVPVSLKNEIFQKAIQKYIDNLSDNDKVAFQSTPDVMEKLRELSQGKPHTSGSYTTCMQRVRKVLQCVQRFLESIKICIQHHPEISSLVVGGLHCILTLALGYIEFFESLTDMMERIGSHLFYLSECSSAALVNSERIQETLVVVYCDLLDFYVKVRGIFLNKEGKASYSQGFKLFLRLMWEPFEEQFKSIETRFLNNADVVFRLVMIHSANANAEQQNNSYKKEIRERQEDEKHNDEERRKILRWLSPDDFEPTHERHLKKRFENTGQWLLDDPRFISWRDESQSSLVWCHGAPGSGKTVLASLVIDHLSALHELSMDTGVTFLYCNYKESRTSTAYIELAIKQICRRIKHLPLQLQEVYKRHFRNDSRPTSDELRSIFLAIALQFNSMFLVLDALDECTLNQREELCKFLFNIIESPAGTSRGIVKLFVTSRKEPDIERAFRRKSFPTIEIEAAKVDKDIAIYTRAQLEDRLNDERLILRNMALKSKILDALTSKAGGMFLWVEFQLDSICAQVSDDAIERALQSVPEDMDTTYDRILEMINKKPQPQRALARRVLMCIAYTRSPLHIHILTYAVSVEYDTKSLEALESSVPTETAILASCSNLVSIDKDKVVRFVHFSVQEYLMRDRPQRTSHVGPDLAHRELARIFISLLSILNHQSLAAWNEGITDRPQVLNILENWPFHLLAANVNLLSDDDPLTMLVSSFLEQSPPMFVGRRGREPPKYLSLLPPVLRLIFNLPSRHQHYQTSSKRKIFNISQLSDLYNQHPITFNDNFAMHYTTGNLDSVPAAQRLFTHGVPLNYFYSEDSAEPFSRHWTSLGREWYCTPIPVDVPMDYYLPPLYSARSEEVARFLLDNGASVDPHSTGETAIDPLLFFECKGNCELTRLVLDRIVGGQRAARYGAVLRSAVEKNCRVEFIQQLLSQGADVNVQGGPYGNALQAAITTDRPNLEVIQLLLDKGADVNAQGGPYGNALQAAIASHHSKFEVVQPLLDKGANVNAQGGKYGNALQAAVSRNNLEVVRLLLDKGADVNAQGGEYNTHALQTAAQYGYLKVVRFLLDSGADVNAQGGQYNTHALHTAAQYGYLKVVRLLLDRGADVNAQGGYYGNALQGASAFHKFEVVQLLLDKGADVNAQGGKYGNALQAASASYDSKLELVQLLLDKGADVNAQGGYYGNALQAASASPPSKIEVVQLLLDKGANVNAWGGRYGTAFQAARSPEISKLLLDHGAIQ